MDKWCYLFALQFWQEKLVKNFGGLSTSFSSPNSLSALVQEFWQQGVLIFCNAFIRNLLGFVVVFLGFLLNCETTQSWRAIFYEIRNYWIPSFWWFFKKNICFKCLQISKQKNMENGEQLKHINLSKYKQWAWNLMNNQKWENNKRKEKKRKKERKKGKRQYPELNEIQIWWSSASFTDLEL